MNTKPPVALLPKPQAKTAVVPPAPKLAAANRNDNTSETMNSITVRATSVTVVLQKIMTSGHGYRHGGLNE